MSVPFNQRQLSKVQFVETARELHKHTYTYALKMPKRMHRYAAYRLMDLANDIYQNVVTANTVRPTTEYNVAFRYEHLIKAKGALESMNGLLSIWYNTKEIKYNSDNPWVEWGKLIRKERNLIIGVISSDRRSLDGTK